jgi:hypothetical protein
MEQVQSPKDKRKKAEKNSKAMKEKWEDQEFREQRSEAQSEAMKERWKDPEFSAHISSLNRERGQQPEFKAHLSTTMTALYNTPEKRAELSEQRTTSLQKPEIYFEHVQMTRDTAEKRSGKMKDNWQDPDFCFKMMKARHGEERARRYVYNKFGVIK